MVPLWGVNYGESVSSPGTLWSCWTGNQTINLRVHKRPFKASKDALGFRNNNSPTTIFNLQSNWLLSRNLISDAAAPEQLNSGAYLGSVERKDAHFVCDALMGLIKLPLRILELFGLKHFTKHHPLDSNHCWVSSLIRSHVNSGLFFEATSRCVLNKNLEALPKRRIVFLSYFSSTIETDKCLFLFHYDWCVHHGTSFSGHQVTIMVCLSPTDGVWGFFILFLCFCSAHRKIDVVPVLPFWLAASTFRRPATNAETKQMKYFCSSHKLSHSDTAVVPPHKP